MSLFSQNFKVMFLQVSTIITTTTVTTLSTMTATITTNFSYYLSDFDQTLKLGFWININNNNKIETYY